MGHHKGKVGTMLAKNKCKIKGKRAVQIGDEVYCFHEFNLRSYEVKGR